MVLCITKIKPVNDGDGGNLTDFSQSAWAS